MHTKKAIVLLVLSIFFFSNLLADTRQKNENVTINGIIIDKESGEYLSDANLWLVKSGIGQTSDKNGHFTFKTQKTGLDTLVVKFMGYQTYKTPVLLEIGKEYNLEILLHSNVLLLETINVAADRPDIESLMMDADPSVYTIKSRNLRNAPTVGFTDVFRTLQKLPSISSTNEVSPHLYIRGGGADQNLVLLDGACVYYPFHFLGINSSFNHDALDQVMLSPGGFSAYFGGRLSSVLSINSKRPTNHPETTINLHSIGADLTTSGKIHEKLGYLVSGRTSFFDVTNKLFMDDIPYTFQDWLGSITFTPSLKQKWQITVFGNQDHLDNIQKYTADLFSLQSNSTKQYKAIDIDKMFWSNRLVSLKWNYKISEFLDVNLNAFKSDYVNSMEKARDFEFPDDLEEEYWQDRDRIIKEGHKINSDYKDNVNNSFIDKTLKASVYWRPKDNYSLIAGVEKSIYSADYSWKKLSDGTIDRYIFFFFDNAPEQKYLFSSAFKNQNGFFENTFLFTDSLSLKAGLRISQWSFQKKINLEPRFRLRLGKNGWKASVALGHYSQGIATSLEEGLVSFLELYFPVQNTQSIQTANHYVAEYGRNFSQNSSLSLSLYYKDFSGLLKSVALPTSGFQRANGVAKGFELSLKTKIFKWDISTSYTWSHTFRSYLQQKYDTNYDHRHKFQLLCNKNTKKGWEFTFAWEFHTGQPYNPGVYHSFVPFFSSVPPHDFNSLRFDSYEMNINRDRIRYPYYHRLDISISKTIRSRFFTWRPFLSLYNAYGAKNVLYYRTAGIVTRDYKNGVFSDPRIERDPFILPVIPTIGLNIKF